MSRFDSKLSPLGWSLLQILDDSSQDGKTSYRPLKRNLLRSSYTSEIDSPRQGADTTFGVKGQCAMVFTKDFDECMSLNELGQTHILQQFFSFYQRKRGFRRWREVVALKKKTGVLERVMFTYFKFKFITCFVTWHLSCNQFDISQDKTFSKRSSCDSWTKELRHEEKAVQFYRHKLLIKSLIQWFGYLKATYSRLSFMRSRSQARPQSKAKVVSRPRSHSRIGGAEISTELNISDLSAISILEKLNALKPKADSFLVQNSKAETHAAKTYKRRALLSWRKFRTLHLKKKKLNDRLRQFRGIHVKRVRFTQWRNKACICVGVELLRPLLIRYRLQRAFIAVRSFAFLRRKHPSESSYVSLGSSFAKQPSEGKSLSSLDDFELQVQIQLLEKKLSALNRELLSEQTFQHNLLLEKKRYKATA
jgi:hypothetical protein